MIVRLKHVKRVRAKGRTYWYHRITGERLPTDREERAADLLGVSVDLDTAANVPSYLAQREIRYPIFTTDEQALESLYPRGEAQVPLTVLLDGQGRILEILQGWSEKSEKALQGLASGL